MSSKAVNIVVITCLLTSGQFCRASVNSKTDELQKDSVIQVYLPREVTIKDDVIRLGQVSIIRGKEPLVARAGEVALGRISVPGQEIIVDRPTVLSRLACSQIPASKVALTGAEKITVKRQHQVIKGSEFVERALSFLKENPPSHLVCQFSPIRAPKDLVVPGASKDIKLSPRLAGGPQRPFIALGGHAGSAGNQAKVRITVLADGEEIGMREVTFRLKYNCRKVVTLVDLPAGAVISPDNVKIEKTLSNYPEPANWSGFSSYGVPGNASQNGGSNPPYGLITKRRLPANTVIRPAMVGLREPAVIVRRNRSVVIRLERPGLLVTAIGKAMQDGRAGEYIKVRNVDSQRIIMARVNENGTVEPVF